MYHPMVSCLDYAWLDLESNYGMKALIKISQMAGRSLKPNCLLFLTLAAHSRQVLHRRASVLNLSFHAVKISVEKLLSAQGWRFREVEGLPSSDLGQNTYLGNEGGPMYAFGYQMHKSHKEDSK